MESLEERNHLECLDEYGRLIIIKINFKNWDAKVWTGSI
jgi:hypothetical protein